MSTIFWKSLTGEISQLFEEQKIQEIQETEESDNEESDNLYRACGTGNVEMVNRCIENGIDPSSYNNAAIRIACEGGYIDMSEEDYIDVINRLLQDKRVDPSAESNSAIKNAIKYGKISVVDLLLQDKRVQQKLKYEVYGLGNLCKQRTSTMYELVTGLHH